MWCPNCGKEILDSASFCMFCGTDLRPYKTSSPAPTPAPTPAPAPTPVPASTGSNLSANPTQDRPGDTNGMRHARQFMRLLDSKGMSYTYKHEREGDNLNGVVRVQLGGGGLNFPPTAFWVDFDFNNSGEGDSIHISAAGVMSFNRSNRMNCLRVCNKVGNERRFARFYLDEDDDLCADVDSWVSDENAADRAYELLMLFAGVFNVTWKDFENAR